MAKNPETAVDLGPIGRAARMNIARIRKSLGLSLAEVASRMTGDHRLSLSSLSKIETGGRRVDIDDLVAISAALDVSPLAIVLGLSADPDAQVTLGGSTTHAVGAWRWALGDVPLSSPDRRGFQARSLPWWLRVDPMVALEDVHPDTRKQEIRMRLDPSDAYFVGTIIEDPDGVDQATP